MQEDGKEEVKSQIKQKSLTTFKNRLQDITKAMGDHYKVLGFAHDSNISRNSSKEDIKAAYRELSRHCHPDIRDDDLKKLIKKYPEFESQIKVIKTAMIEAQKAINEAYELLQDDQKRREYDSQLGQRASQTVGATNHDKTSGNLGDFFDIMFGADADFSRLAIKGTHALNAAAAWGSKVHPSLRLPIRQRASISPRPPKPEPRGRYHPDIVLKVLEANKKQLMDALSLSSIERLLKREIHYDNHNPDRYFDGFFTIKDLFKLVALLNERIGFHDDEKEFLLKLGILPDTPLGNHIKKIAEKEWEAVSAS